MKSRRRMFSPPNTHDTRVRRSSRRLGRLHSRLTAFAQAAMPCDVHGLVDPYAVVYTPSPRGNTNSAAGNNIALSTMLLLSHHYFVPSYGSCVHVTSTHTSKRWKLGGGGLLIPLDIYTSFKNVGVMPCVGATLPSEHSIQRVRWTWPRFRRKRRNAVRYFSIEMVNRHTYLSCLRVSGHSCSCSSRNHNVRLLVAPYAVHTTTLHDLISSISCRCDVSSTAGTHAA